MAELLDSLKDKVGQVISSVDKGGQVRSAIEGLRRQIAEAYRKRQIKRVESDLARLMLQVEQATMALGLQTVALHEAGKLNHAELSSVCQHIVEIKAEIGKLEQELAQLQPPPAPVAQVGTSCPSCGKLLPQVGDFCPYCGAKREPVVPEARFCLYCGAALRPGAKFCPACGQSVGVSS